jgi:hypothetical protein
LSGNKETLLLDSIGYDLLLCSNRGSAAHANLTQVSSSPTGRAHTAGEIGEWGETKQRSENQVALYSVLGPFRQHKNS